MLSFVLDQAVFFFDSFEDFGFGEVVFWWEGVTGFGYCMVDLCFSNLLVEGSEQL